MIKKLFNTVLFSFCIGMMNGQSIPDVSIPLIDGDTIHLGQYKGKKLLVIVLPVSHATTDSLALLNIANAYNSYKDSIEFIGVPSYEDGFADSLSLNIASWYRETLHLSFPITTGMYSHNSSDSLQSTVFQWLTNESLNGHFGTDVNTHDQKFLLNQDGELKGVFDPSTPLSNSLMNIIIGM